jgi:DNA-binding transcriptional MerR regulator
MSKEQYTIDQLCEMTGLTRRTIRYYVQEGLVDPPAGRGRGGFYNDSHLRQLNNIKSLRDRKVSLAAISAQMRAGPLGDEEPDKSDREVWARIEVIPGVEVSIRRDIEERAGRKISEIVRLARIILKEEMADEMGRRIRFRANNDGRGEHTSRGSQRNR